MTSPETLRAALQLDGRLDVLCCLVGSEPLTITQISARMGAQISRVSYYLETLESLKVIEKLIEAGDESKYVERLDRHPPWVREMVEAHRQA